MKGFILLTIVGIGVYLAGFSQAHRSGCHRWHSCPSDSGSYECGDLGYSTFCGDATEPTDPTPLYDADSATNAKSKAPKLNWWVFGGCTSGGAESLKLIAGRAATCRLKISYQSNGAQPLKARFSYTLKFNRGTKEQKLVLEEPDLWPSNAVKLNKADELWIFALPIQVRVRPDRRYHTLEVKGVLEFDNGTRKTILEPLPIVYR